MVDELLLFVSLDNLAKEDIIVICFKARSVLYLEVISHL